MEIGRELVHRCWLHRAPWNEGFEDVLVASSDAHEPGGLEESQNVAFVRFGTDGGEHGDAPEAVACGSVAGLQREFAGLHIGAAGQVSLVGTDAGSAGCGEPASGLPFNALQAGLPVRDNLTREKLYPAW